MFTLKLFLSFAMIVGVNCKLAPCSKGVNKTGFCQVTTEYPQTPLVIKPYFQIMKIMRIHEDAKSIKVYFNLMLRWNDTGIQVMTPENEIIGQAFEVPKANFEDLLWKQTSILFQNSLGSDKDKTYGNGAYSYFWYIPPHLMLYADVLTQIVSCEMNFQLFPFDHHECDMIFYLTQHPADYVMFEPPTIFKKDKNVSNGDGELEIPTKRLPFSISAESLNTSTVYQMGWKRSATGVRFRFARNTIGLLLGGYYVPTGIFASLSLVSFIIKPEVVPGRMGLLVTLFLISTNVYGKVAAPSGRGFSLIEVWMLGTNFPILAAIVEYGMVMILQNKKVSCTIFGKDQEDFNMNLKRIDNFALIISFIYQIIFTILYWIIAHSL